MESVSLAASILPCPYDVWCPLISYTYLAVEDISGEGACHCCTGVTGHTGRIKGKSLVRTEGTQTKSKERRTATVGRLLCCVGLMLYERTERDERKGKSGKERR
jgi:hypothetical protein